MRKGDQGRVAAALGPAGDGDFFPADGGGGADTWGPGFPRKFGGGVGEPLGQVRPDAVGAGNGVGVAMTRGERPWRKTSAWLGRPL